MASKYSQNPHVVGWQIDNEFGNSHRDLCACESCRNQFHKWLERKYTTIDRLNEAWGTVFWSQTYSRFDQIPAPLPTPNSHNPSLLLDWKRFASDLVVDFQRVQVDILRKECPSHFITHNFMGFFDKTDYFELAKDLDFISHDQYPMHFRSEKMAAHTYANLAMELDLMRGTKQQPFWIMEEQAGPAGWETIGTTPRPGQLRLWTYQSVAHGADTIVYFRWRTCLFGTEEYWHGILPHSGEPGRRYDEVKQTIGELAPIMDGFKGGLPGAEVGMLFSYDQEWALQIQPHHPELNYLKHLQGYYQSLHANNIPVDLLSPAEDFTNYKVLIAPLLFLMTPELAAKLENYVAGGGHLVLTMRTSVKDWNNSVIPKTLPCDLGSLLGIKIYDYDCLRNIDMSVRWTHDESEAASKEEAVRYWSDIITLDGAEALAVYTRDYYVDTPTITRNVFGNGAAYYVGTELGPQLLETFVGHLIGNARIERLAESPHGVEVTRRQGRDGSYFFVMNHNSYPSEMKVPENWTPVLGKEAMQGDNLQLGAYQVAVFRSEK